MNVPRAGTPSVDGFGPLVRVGRGGFASVYRAEDQHIGRVVAVKVLEHIDVADPRARDRFLRETRAMGRLSGLPHVVDIYQATFTTDGQPCIVMPFFAGGSLEDRLAASGPLPVGSALAVGVTIGRAVDAAHRRGLSHRDLKPGNILIDERGTVALADFGIAVVEDAAASQRTRTALSPEHAAPERLVTPPDGPAPEAWGDQFSLASTVYMLLTGTPPFGLVAEVGLHEVLRRIVEAPAPPIGRDDVPPALEAVLARALAKQPEARYPSASAFADALLEVGVPLADPPVTAPVPADAPAVPILAPADVDAPVTAWSPQPMTTRSGASVIDWSSAPPPYLRVSPPGPAPTQHRTAPTSAPRRAPDQAGPAWPVPGGPSLVPPMPPLPPPDPRFAEADAGGHTIVPEHRRVEPAAAPAAPGAPDGASGRRFALVLGAVAVLILAAGGAGFVLLKGRAPVGVPVTTAIVTGPPPPDASVPLGTSPPPGANVVRPRIDSLQPVERGLVVFWKDDGAREAKGYGWEVTVDGERRYKGNMTRKDDGTWRPTQEITTLERAGRTEVIDAAAHQYCVVIQRLEVGSPVNSEPACTPRPRSR